jgi:hypothetical protein
MWCAAIARGPEDVIMAEAKDDAALVLDALQHGDDPSAEDAARVRRAVWARLGLAGAVGAVVATGVQPAATHAGAAAVGVKSAWVVTVAKVGLAAALVTGGGWYASTVLNPGHSSLQSVAPGPAVVAAAPAQDPRVDVVEKVSGELPPNMNTPGPSTESSQVTTTAKPPPFRGAGESDALDSEVALLGKAQRALSSGRYSEALASLQQHATRFPKGALTGEREASRAIALCRSGSSTRGREIAARYLARHAESPLCARVRAACGLER